MQVDEDLEAALRLSMGESIPSNTSDNNNTNSNAANTKETKIKPLGVGLTESFRGQYELFAVVSHKGRDSSSGHYMGWIRQSGKEWLVFDDDSVSPTDTETVVSVLKGGGDEHMAYMLFYRAMQ